MPGDGAGLGEVTVGVGVAHRAVSADEISSYILIYIQSLQMNKVPFGMYVSSINDGLGKLQNCMIASTLDSFALSATVTTLMHKSFVHKNHKTKIE